MMLVGTVKVLMANYDFSKPWPYAAKIWKDNKQCFSFNREHPTSMIGLVTSWLHLTWCCVVGVVVHAISNVGISFGTDCATFQHWQECVLNGGSGQHRSPWKHARRMKWTRPNDSSELSRPWMIGFKPIRNYILCCRDYKDSYKSKISCIINITIANEQEEL